MSDKTKEIIRTIIYTSVAMVVIVSVVTLFWMYIIYDLSKDIAYARYSIPVMLAKEQVLEKLGHVVQATCAVGELTAILWMSAETYFVLTEKNHKNKEKKH